MLNVKQRLAFAATALALSSPTWPESDGYYFDCDVPSGRYSTWNGPVASGNKTRVSGTVEVLVLRHDKRWWPAGSIFLEGDDEQVVGVQAYVDWRRTDIVQLGVFSGQRTQIAEIELTDEPIPFDISLTRSGTLTVTIAGNTEVVEAGAFDVRRINLSCSSGHFKFRDVRVERQ